LFSTAAVLGALAAPAAAQEEGALAGVSAEVTVDYVTNYFFRGYEQQTSDEGIVIQPGASFSMPVADGVTATIGTWGSIHSENGRPNGATATGSWYEQDVFANLDATFGDFTVSLGLTLYTYPNVAGTDVFEASIGLAYDDSELLGDFAFSPYIFLATEINNSNVPNTAVANPAATAGSPGKEATYLEIGGEFSLDTLTEGTFAEAWSWSVPIAAGFSIDDYYNDGSGAEEFFGYASIGVVGTVPLSELIGDVDYISAWDLTIGVTAILNNGDLNGRHTNRINDNGGRDVQFVGTVGISREW
jgi:hypothetical protein